MGLREESGRREGGEGGGRMTCTSVGRRWLPSSTASTPAPRKCALHAPRQRTEFCGARAQR
eukprot:232772-Rhodomonas_salina.1